MMAGFGWAIGLLAAILGTAPDPPPSPAPPPFSETSLELRVESWPPDSSVIVQASDGAAYSGRTPWVVSISPGQTSITLTSPGLAPRHEIIDLRSKLTYEGCLQPDDQRVRCRRWIRCGHTPKAVSLSPDATQIWVTLLIGPPSVEVFDARSGQLLTRLNLGAHGTVEMAWDPQGESVYISQMESGKIYEVHRTTFAVLRTITTRGDWPKILTIAPHSRQLFASNWISGDISVVDLRSGQALRRIPAVKIPRGLFLTPDEATLYVAGFGRGQLFKLDLATRKGKIIWSKGGALRHLVGDPSRDRLYISNMARDQILTLDLTTDEVTEFVSTNHKPNTVDLAADGQLLFVSNRGKNGPDGYIVPGPEWGSVLIFDTTSGEILDAIVGGNQTTGLDVSDDGRVLVFSDFLDRRVRVYDVPPVNELRTGGGGRKVSHRADLQKTQKKRARRASPTP